MNTIISYSQRFVEKVNNVQKTTEYLRIVSNAAQKKKLVLRNI